MSSTAHIHDALSDDEVWARSLAKCAQYEGVYWGIGLVNLVSVLIEVLLHWTFAMALGMSALFAGFALFIRLSTQYWRVIGFLPVEPYWRRVRDLAPQFMAVGMAAFSLLWFAQQSRVEAPEQDLWSLGFMCAGAVLGFAMALLCARAPNMTKLRHLFE